MKLLLLSVCSLLNFVLQLSADPNDSCGQRDDPSWKWHVQLLYTQVTEQDLNCGGTLLNKLFVTTTAHCLYDLNGDPFDISQLRILLADGESRSIRRTFQPKPYNVENLSNDFVLILLEREVKFNKLVGPVCVPKEYEILGYVRTPVLQSETLPINDADTCLKDARTLFGMFYLDAICLGTFDRTHKYHRNAGSGIYVERRSKWYLVGLVMYTTGPTSVHIAYIGGIHLERYLTWIKTTMDHHSEVPSITEKECQAYMRNSDLLFKEYHPIVNLVDAASPRILCHGTLISPRYVLTTTRCAWKTKRVLIHYGIDDSSDWFEKTRDRTEPFDEQLSLIELDRDVKNTASVLICLNSNVARQDSVNFTTRIAHTDSFVRLEQIRVQYQINVPLQVHYYCFRYSHHGHFTSPGDAIVIKNENEQFHRVVGLLENELDCGSSDYFYERKKSVQAINIEKYLPWIEDIVWGGK